MPFAQKRRLENEKKLQSDAKKCQKINSFFVPIERNKDREESDNTSGHGSSQEIHDREQNNLSVQNDDDINGNENQSMNSVNDDGNKETRLEKHQTPVCLIDEDVESMSVFYKGFRLNAKAIVEKAGTDVLRLYSEKIRTVTAKKARKRLFIKCLICCKHEEEATRFAVNHKVYIAQGVRCDGQKKLKDIINHLHGAPHTAAIEREKLEQQWNSKDSDHPWLKTMKSNDPSVINTLVHMAVDVYNDSKLLTLAAWSWPSRSLANMHGEQQAKVYANEESNGEFSQFKPTAVDLHYRDPIHYAELLEIEGSIEKEKLKDELQTCLRFSMQIDGSVDTKQHDKKFVFVRFNKPESPLEVHTRFVSARESEKRGAEGLFCAAQSSIEGVGLTKNEIQAKFVGVSSDGESANTGRISGLWTRMEEYVGHPTLNVWCACHRSDLAMEDLMQSVPELKVWNTNVISVATYYRASGLRTKELKTINPTAKAFPAHHEIRFAQHLIQLCEAVLSNLQGCRKHWSKIVEAPSGEYERNEKSKAQGFLNVWQSSSLQEWLTAFMIDVCSVFRYVEKETQKPQIIVPDILRYRDIALQKLDLLKDKPYPGGQEESLEKQHDLQSRNQEPEATPRSGRTTNHAYVTTMRRNKSAIRVEIRESASNFLQERLNDEQSDLVKSIIALTTSNTAAEFISTSLPLLNSCSIPKTETQAFIDSVLENFTEMKPGEDIAMKDYGVRLYIMLRGSKGPVTGFLSSFCVLSPHSMTVEKCVSTYSILFSDLRTSSSEDTLDSRLLIHWNGVPTACYDPRPAVQNFMLRRDRRMRLPVVSTYRGRDFVKKFFN